MKANLGPDAGAISALYIKPQTDEQRHDAEKKTQNRHLSHSWANWTKQAWQTAEKVRRGYKT